MKKLRACEISKSYNRRKVVDGLSVLVEPGEVVGLLGPNGAGKTTSFHVIVGLISPDSGSVLLDDEEITSFPMYQRARKGISYLPQEPSVFRKLTVEENLMAILETLRLNGRARRERMHTLIEQLGLEKVRRNKSYTLSGGERRRVEIARSLVIEPRFLLLDEPFSGIDPIQVLELQRIIFDLKRSGIGILVTDHNVRETLAVTDRAYIIHNGKIFRAGSPRGSRPRPRGQKHLPGRVLPTGPVGACRWQAHTASRPVSGVPLLFDFDPHAVEAAVHEHHRDRPGTRPTAPWSSTGPCWSRQRNRQFHRQQAEQRGELDDRVQRHRTGVLERIADRVADHAGRVQLACPWRAVRSPRPSSRCPRRRRRWP